MNKNEQEIMVIDRNVLFMGKVFQGFQGKRVDYLKRILDMYKFMQRGKAETNPYYKQPIAYAVIVNSNKVFAFQRASDENYSEKRLHGKWSIGVGGHVEKPDEESDNPILLSLQRELKEELIINGSFYINHLGYINLEDTAVDKVHFGLLYIIKTESKVTPKDPEIKQGKFFTINKLKQMSKQGEFEAWSKIALSVVIKHLT